MLWVLLRLWARELGFKEAVLYSLKGADAFAHDEHRDWVRERVTVALMPMAALLEAWLLTTVAGLPPAVVLTWPLAQLGAWWLAFSYDHNQRYYATRAAIAGTPYKSTASSSTSSARFEFDYDTRLLLRTLSWLLLLAYWAVALLILLIA